MSKCPDKALDLAETVRVIRREATPGRGDLSWLRHEKKWKGYELDMLLLRGVEDAKLEACRVSWRAHIDHLRYVHGLEVERDERGYWKITGRSDALRVKRNNTVRTERSEETGEKKKRPITDEQYRRGYELGRDVFEGDTTKEEAIAELVDMGTNETSGSYMLQITRGMLSGEVFKLSLKDEAHGWYLGWILRDFGPDGLERALAATRLHLAYDLGNGAKRIRLREIVASYERILKGEPPVDNNDARGGREAELKRAWVKLRYGQPEFRRKLLLAYNGRCAVTGADVERVLEAAHIKGYAQDGESRVSNGLLLRSDIHALFDADLMGIDPDNEYRVELSPALMGSEYWELQGREVRLPKNAALSPDKGELQEQLKRLRAGK